MFKRISLLVLLLSMTSIGPSLAQEWPSKKAIRIIAVFPPGGSVDAVARVLAPALQEQLKQSVIVENIGGASGVIGTDAMVRAEPDGYTFAVVFDTHGVNQSLKEKMPYDTKKDIANVTLIGTSPMVLVASKSSGISSFKQLVDETRAGKNSSYGTIGAGSLGHLAMATLAKKSNFEWTHIPYRGGGPMMADALAGHVPLAIGSIFLIKPHIDTSRVVPLAVTSTQRSKDLPNIPTIAESGFPGFDAPAWWGVIAPVKTPPEMIRKMHQAMVVVLKRADIAKKLDDQGIDILAGNPETFNTFLDKQMNIWGKFVIDNKIREN
ncbi:MAG: tripartite tricarboxylate transporter substrate binding protein [Burkholderiales bacterium]|jgi:tripartite-type tricarboxylate transporter receptor subunit TctC|nr:tripartite tricarboxylate transporter substrate binding protein [Burkholderiales bacterium]